MKKIISFISALLVGSVAIAQAVKTDTIKKPATRKVLPADLKTTTNIPPPNNKPGTSYTEKYGPPWDNQKNNKMTVKGQMLKKIDSGNTVRPVRNKNK
jgi:hypothetical protein